MYGTLVNLISDENKDSLWKYIAMFYSYNGAFYEPQELKEEYFLLVKNELLSNFSTEYPDIKIEHVFQELYTKKGVSPHNLLVIETTHLFRILSTENIELYPKAVELLKLLKKNNFKIYLLSNGQREFTVPELKYLKLLDYFEGIYFSSDIGICKPDVKFFEYLIEEEGLIREECLMVGNDSRTDIEGARGAGIAACYIHSNLSGEPPLFCDYKILNGNLDEIIKILSVENS